MHTVRIYSPVKTVHVPLTTACVVIFGRVVWGLVFIRFPGLLPEGIPTLFVCLFLCRGSQTTLNCKETKLTLISSCIN